MILKYVLKNFSRRKVRTFLMILALMISTGLIVSMSSFIETLRQSTVDLVASETGEFDFVISKKDTSRELFLPIEETAVTLLAVDDRITAVHPRLQINLELVGSGGIIGVTGLASATDDIGKIEVVEGDYKLGDGYVAINQFAANNRNLKVGDVLNVAYAVPTTRLLGESANRGTSQSRRQRQFTISAIVRQNGVTGSSNDDLFAELSDLQTWLDLPDQAGQMIIVVDPNIYARNNAETAALEIRDIALAVENTFGAEYQFRLDKPSFIAVSGQAFLALQAIVNTFGFISLGVVGLLVYTLVMTNVQEQRRDMAVLRILGSDRSILFGLVIVEVVVVGSIGVGLGVVVGQFLTTYAFVPLFTYYLQSQGASLNLTPQLSAAGILPPVISAFTILVLSSLRPANDASNTKIMYAINPGVADNIQLEELTQLRERRPNFKLFLAGFGLILLFGLLAGFDAIAQFGGPSAQVIFILLGFMGLVMGLSLMFFVTTIPFERFVLFVMGFAFPRLAYFAQKNVKRGKGLNTLISLLVLFSAVLPSFLGTNTQLELANLENGTRMNMGAPLSIQSLAKQDLDEVEEGVTPQIKHIKPSLIQEMRSVSGVGNMAGITYRYSSVARDAVGFRQASIDVIGLESDLRPVLFEELMAFTAGTPQTLQTILNDPNGVIISEGLADYLGVGMGETIELQGVGLDNLSEARVVGIIRRIPGISGITRSRITAASGSAVFVSLDHFQRLITELNKPLPNSDDPIIEQVFATLQPNMTADAVALSLHNQYGTEHQFWANSLQWQLEEERSDLVFFTSLMLALTGISFITAVFAVFAIIFISIYSRRIEIGMLKAMGMLRRELSGMLILEAIAMTLGAVLAGITAGASMGYLNYYVSRAIQQAPVIFAFDYVVIPAMVVMVILASMLGAGLSARRIVRKQAVEILRMS